MSILYNSLETETFLDSSGIICAIAGGLFIRKILIGRMSHWWLNGDSLLDFSSSLERRTFRSETFSRNWSDQWIIENDSTCLEESVSEYDWNCIILDEKMEAFRDRVRLWVGERFPQFQQQVETNVNESRNMFQEKYSPKNYGFWSLLFWIHKV